MRGVKIGVEYCCQVAALYHIGEVGNMSGILLVDGSPKLAIDTLGIEQYTIEVKKYSCFSVSQNLCLYTQALCVGLF